jgi:hypothetical protein
MWDDGTYSVYIDGVLKDSSTYTGLTTLNNNAHIGNTGTTFTQSWEGLLDDVRIYDRALSAEEIDRLYKLGR